MPESVGGYVGWLAASKARPRLVLLAALLAVAVAATAGDAFSFAKNCAGFDIVPTAATAEALQAYTAIEAAFPATLASDSELVLVRAATGSVVTPQAEQICKEVLAAMEQIKADHPEAGLTDASFAWYWKYAGTPLDALKRLYVTADEQTTAFLVTFPDAKAVTPPLLQAIRDAVTQLAAKAPSGYSVEFTGRLDLIDVAQQSTGIGFAIADGGGLPFIAVLFWYMVGAGRMLLLPALSLGASLITAYAVGNAFAVGGMYVPQYEPNIMLFLSLALAVDYSFFLVTRLQEERKLGKSLVLATSISFRRSGSTVAVSGGILVVTWACLGFFPVYGLFGVGICSAITVLMCILYNLLLTPAMLLAFPEFFGRSGFEWCRCCRRRGSVPLEALAQLQDEPLKPSAYAKCGKIVTTKPWSILLPLVVFALFATGASRLADLNLSLALNVDYGSGPASTAYANALRDLAYTPGLSLPFLIYEAAPAAAEAPCVPGPKQPCGVLTADFFARECALAKKLAKVNGVVGQSLEGVSFSLDYATGDIVCRDLDTALAGVGGSDALYAHLYAQHVDLATNRSALLTFAPGFNPFSNRVSQFADDLRAALGPESPASGLLYHPTVTEYDAKEFTYKRLPAVLVGSILGIFALVSLRFRAAIVPVKLFLTIVCPIFFVFGVAVAVYQEGLLNFLGWGAVASGGADGLSWLLPCATVFLLIGLALDYDIFLFARVYELRADPQLGLNTQEAIVKAVSLTGPTISAAGIIMCLAFSGMLANDNHFLNQFGFIMVLGILLDTFVVRIVLVPALLSLGGWINWWPRKMPLSRDRWRLPGSVPLTGSQAALL